MTPPTTYHVQGEATSPKFSAAFAKGCGGSLAPASGGLQAGNFAAFCTPPTWPLLQQAKAEGRTWFYGDHAFYRRGHYYRVTRNGYQYVPTATDLTHARPERFLACHVDLHPGWREQVGSAIIVCPNSPTYMAMFGIDAHQWVLDVVDTLGRHTDRPIVVRWKAQAQRRPLYVDLHDAWAVVVFSSNAAVEAIAAGVPVFVLAPWAATAQMGHGDLTQIESPVYPDQREPFLWALAQHQWSLKELASGDAWKALRRD